MNLIFKWENDLNNQTVLYQIYFHTSPRDEVFILWVNNSLQQSKLSIMTYQTETLQQLELQLPIQKYTEQMPEEQRTVNLILQVTIKICAAAIRILTTMMNLN